MGNSPTPPGLIERIMQMVDERIAAFARSGFLRNARITKGGLTIADGGKLSAEYPIDLGGRAMLYVGRIVSAVDGTYQGTGLLLQAPDGTDMMVVRTDAEFGTTMHNIYDSGGRTIVGNDAASGQGLARPYVPGVFYRQRYTDWLSTTSATFEGIFKAEMFKQHPRVSVAVQVAIDDAATTGELEVLVNGVQLGVVAIPFGIRVLTVGPAAVAGAHMALLSVEIRARRVAGTGTVRVEPLHAYGRQS